MEGIIKEDHLVFSRELCQRCTARDDSVKGLAPEPAGTGDEEGHTIVKVMDSPREPLSDECSSPARKAWPGKRGFDIAGALAGLIAASPIMGGIALLLRWRQGSPVLFSQERAGLGGKPFRMWKFRTMTDERDEQGALRPDGERLTPIGRWLRSTSLDELPELWNVLRGDMSLVGPRPLPVTYLERYTPLEATRHHVRPGLTGWAQVNGRNSLGWEERLAMDSWYAANRSALLDFNIIARTVAIVIGRQDIGGAGIETMTELPDDRLGTRVRSGN